MILCVGELLLRLMPDFGRAEARLFVGGAEANVAASLAAWKMPVAYFTALPQHMVGTQALQQLTNTGVDASRVLWQGPRMGSYYLHQGADMKAAGVVYDRAGSSFSLLEPGTIDWDSVLQGITHLHWSAISPALSRKAAQVCAEMLEAATEKQIRISVDLNYRNKLWQYALTPPEIMQPLLQHCHVLMGNLWAVEALLGEPLPLSASLFTNHEALTQAAFHQFGLLKQRYPGLDELAYTFRMSDAYFAVMRRGQEEVVSRERPIPPVADKVGTGDSFMAGLLYGHYAGFDAMRTLTFSVGAALSKFGVEGDFNRTPADAILASML